MTIQQISVFLENRSGQISEITNVLAEKGIDLRAVHVADSSDYGILRLITTKPQEASQILLEQGFVLSMTPVLAVGAADEPGSLAKILSILAEANLDIEYMYSVFGKKDGMAYMVFRVSDIQQFEDVLTKNGFSTVGGEALGIN